MTTAEKCEEVLKKVLVLVNEDDNRERRVAFEADWGGNSLTVYVDDAHSHCGDPHDSWETLVNNLYGLLCQGQGLGFCSSEVAVSNATVDDIVEDKPKD